MTVYVDPALSMDELREEVFAGHVAVLTKLPAVRELAAHMQGELAELFAPYDPRQIHRHLEPAQLASLLGEWKPRFIHAARSQELVRAVIEQAGCEPARTHYDVPKPRTSFPVGSLNTGIAFAFPWHRDAWYSAPPQQINWWMPVFPVRSDNAMSFDFTGFGVEVPNNSGDFDYYRHNAARAHTAEQVDREVQARPGAIGHEAPDEVVVLPPPGGIMLFSGAQLHRSIPNTSPLSRYSIDFRTVDVRDVVDGRGAPVVDARCGGTAIRDFRNVADGSAFDEDLVVRKFGAPPADAMLVYTPDDAAAASAVGAR